MLSETHEFETSVEVGTGATERFQAVASLSMTLARFPDVDGIFDNDICVLRDIASVPQELISDEYPRLNSSIIQYFGMASPYDPIIPSGIKYINLTENPEYKGKMLKALRKNLGLKVLSLNNLLGNMGVDGIEPSTTAL